MAVPRMYRTMMPEDDGKPTDRDLDFGLAVRTRSEPSEAGRHDVDPDDEANVHPAGGGMSVRRDHRRFPPGLVPPSWRDSGYPKARGPEGSEMWRMGDGPFEAAPVADGLRLRPDAGGRPKHGVVEPAHIMGLDAYRSAVAATRSDWHVVQPEEEQ